MSALGLRAQVVAWRSTNLTVSQLQQRRHRPHLLECNVPSTAACWPSTHEEERKSSVAASVHLDQRQHEREHATQANRVELSSAPNALRCRDAHLTAVADRAVPVLHSAMSSLSDECYQLLLQRCRAQCIEQVRFASSRRAHSSHESRRAGSSARQWTCRSRERRPDSTVMRLSCVDLRCQRHSVVVNVWERSRCRALRSVLLRRLLRDLQGEAEKIEILNFCLLKLGEEILEEISMFQANRLHSQTPLLPCIQISSKRDEIFTNDFPPFSWKLFSLLSEMKNFEMLSRFQFFLSLCGETLFDAARRARRNERIKFNIEALLLLQSFTSFFLLFHFSRFVNFLYAPKDALWEYPEWGERRRRKSPLRFIWGDFSGFFFSLHRKEREREEPHRIA